MCQAVVETLRLPSAGRLFWHQPRSPYELVAMFEPRREQLANGSRRLFSSECPAPPFPRSSARCFTLLIPAAGWNSMQMILHCINAPARGDALQPPRRKRRMTLGRAGKWDADQPSPPAAVLAL